MNRRMTPLPMAMLFVFAAASGLSRVAAQSAPMTPANGRMDFTIQLSVATPPPQVGDRGPNWCAESVRRGLEGLPVQFTVDWTTSPPTVTTTEVGDASSETPDLSTTQLTPAGSRLVFDRVWFFTPAYAGLAESYFLTNGTLHLLSDPTGTRSQLVLDHVHVSRHLRDGDAITVCEMEATGTGTLSPQD